MIWVKYKEKWHGKKYIFWTRKSNILSARKEVKQWNQFNNPYERLTLVTTRKDRPTGLRKTRYRGIYKPYGVRKK